MKRGSAERHEDADRFFPDDQGRPEPRARADTAHQVGVGVGVVEDRVHPRGHALQEDASGLRALDGEPLPDQLLGVLAVCRRDLELPVGRRHEDCDKACVQEPAHAIDDEL